MVCHTELVEVFINQTPKIMKEISIKEVKETREALGFQKIVILGIDNDFKQHVVTHGNTTKDADIAAKLGNDLKKVLKWPDDICNIKPLKRICGNCHFLQNAPVGEYKECAYEPMKAIRDEEDISCCNFEPNC